MKRPRRSAVTVAALSTLAVLVGCEAPPELASPGGRWTCPAAWVASSRGGCGPAALLCASGGEAAPGVCASIGDAGTVTTPLGATLRAVHRLPDGGFAGAWVEAGDPSGPPSEGWTPEAPARCTAGASGACSASGGDVTLDDVLIRGVSPSARRLGVGVFVGEGARFEGHRVAVDRVAGARLLQRRRLAAHRPRGDCRSARRGRRDEPENTPPRDDARRGAHGRQRARRRGAERRPADGELDRGADDLRVIGSVLVLGGA